MNELNKKYVLQMEVLTPLHVGAGAEKDWVQGADFVIHEGKVKILNLNKVAEYVKIDDLSTALINKNGNSLVAKLGGNIDMCVEKEFNCSFTGTNDIKTCIKNGLTNQPIVPGSSLKGAIRSILLEALHTKSQISNAKDNNGRWSEQALFGSANKGNEFFRFIKLSDAQFEITGLVNSKIFNLKSQAGGWKHERYNTTNKFNPIGFNTYYEIIEPGEKSIFSISMASKAFENFGASEFLANKQQLIKNDISELFRIINKHTKEYLEKEKAFFKKYTTDKSDKIIDCIDNLLNKISQNGDCCVLKMAAGSGFHSITGDWQFDDYSIDGVDTTRAISRGTLKGQKSAKSRKIAILPNDELCLMGFVMLTSISKEEIQKIEAEKLRIKLETENQLKAKVEEIAEHKRLEEAIIKQLEENRRCYNQLLQEAQLLYEKQDPEAAKLKIEKAIELFPDEVKHNELNSLITKAIATKLKDEEILKKVKELKQARIDSNKIPLSEKIAKADKFPTIFGNVKSWMKANEISTLQVSDVETLTVRLIEVYSRMKANDKKAWLEYKKWHELETILGVEISKEIFARVVT